MGVIKDLPNYWTKVGYKVRQDAEPEAALLPGEPLSVLVLLLVCLEVASITGKSSGVPLTLFCPPSPQQKHMSEHLQGVPGIDLSGSYYEVCSPVSTGAFDDGTVATWRGMDLRSSSVPWAQV